MSGEEPQGFIMQIASLPLEDGEGPQWQITSGQIGWGARTRSP